MSFAKKWDYRTRFKSRLQGYLTHLLMIVGAKMPNGWGIPIQGFSGPTSLYYKPNACAAAFANCTAVESAERFAAFVSFQRIAASLPPTQNVNSALISLTAA